MMATTKQDITLLHDSVRCVNDSLVSGQSSLFFVTLDTGQKAVLKCFQDQRGIEAFTKEVELF